MTTKAQILDIAMNLNRVGNWAADGYEKKKKRIHLFLKQTTQYLEKINKSKLPPIMQRTFTKFLIDYARLEKETILGPKDELKWAEKMMTWGNILTHRSILIQS